RRRHTRFSRDWSSDVCSSDLIPLGRLRAKTQSGEYLCDRLAVKLAISRLQQIVQTNHEASVAPSLTRSATGLSGIAAPCFADPRSEEARVGQERRARCSAKQQ